MKDTNWLWKPEKHVTRQISRGNKITDPMRNVKLQKRAEKIGFRAMRMGENFTNYEFELHEAEKSRGKVMA